MEGELGKEKLEQLTIGRKCGYVRRFHGQILFTDTSLARWL